MIAGFDITAKNKKVNWGEIPTNRFKFVYLKSGESLYNFDSQYQEYALNAKRRGLLIGAYHWLNPKLDTKNQAENFVRTVGSFTEMLPPVACLEFFHTTITDMVRNVKLFIDTVTNLTGKRTTIYTSMDFWSSNFPEAEWANKSYLWVDFPGNTFPPQVYPWAGWTFWQSSYQSMIPGIEGNAGFNWFNGTMDDLYRLI